MTLKGEILPPAALSGSEIEWRPPKGLSPEERQRAWGRSFSVVYRAGVAAIVTAGRILVEAKAEIPHGEWADWIEFHTPISDRTARQLMQIANDPNIARHAGLNRHHDTVLPQDRIILAELCGLEPDRFDGLVSEGAIHPEMKRGDVRRRLVEQPHGGSQAEARAFPDGKYGVILADPPWRFEARGAGGYGRSAENHYPTMSADELALMAGQVRSAAAEDCALFLWTISSHLDAALLTMRQWGFDFRATAFVWAKEGAPGLGYWTRCRTEICLLGARGRPKRLAADVDELIHAPRGRHSEKPEEVYERIERLVAGPYIELFARRARPGWDGWGNDPALAEAAE